MPWLSGKSSGKGKSAPRQKACPIARPSRDYQRQIDSRDYSEDTKESREEIRKWEVEERIQQRASGQEVDLGKSAAYWEMCSAPLGRPAPRYDQFRASRPTYSESRSWTSGPASAAAGAAVASARAVPAEASPAAGSDESWGKWRGTSSIWSEPTWKEPTGKSSQKGAGSASSWSSTDVSGSGGAARDFNLDDKARRAQLRAQEAEQRRKAREGGSAELFVDKCLSSPDRVAALRDEPSPEPPSVSSTRASTSSWRPPIGSAVVAQSRRPPIGSAVEAQPRKSWRRLGLDDHNLDEVCQEILKSSPLEVLDLSGYSLTDQGLQILVEFLVENRVVIGELKLSGNPLREPIALILLLNDPHIGVGFLKSVHVTTTGLTCEALWRILEVFAKKKERPAFRLCIADGVMGELENVLPRAEEHGLSREGPVDENFDNHHLDVDLLLVTVNSTRQVFQ